MRRLIAVPRSAYVPLGVMVAALTLAACKPKDRAPDSARVDTGVGTPPNTLTTPPPAGARLPGQLEKPIDQYTGDEFYALVQRLAWGGGADRERACKGQPSCDDATAPKFTTVRVDAVDGQDSLSALGVPTDGVIALRALNRGDATEARYGMKPGKQLEYFLIVLPGKGDAGTWRLEELDTTPGARRHSSAGTGAFRPCNHPYRPKRVNRANFFTCQDSPTSDSVQKSGMVMFDPKKDPLWAGCAQGCCVADG